MSTTAIATLGTTRTPEFNNGIVTSWIPLTTEWPSSSGCESLMWKAVPDTLAAWDPGYGIWVKRGVSCHPPEMTSWWDAEHLSTNINLDVTQLSLGPVVCPEAYTTAMTFVNGGGSTLINCCPSGYSYAGNAHAGNPRQCTSPLTLGQVVSYGTYNGSRSAWEIVTSTVNTVSPAYGVQVNGYLFPEPTTSSSIATATSAVTTSALPTSDNSGSSGLSPGAKVGIGVGVGAGALVVAVVVGLFLFRRHKRKQPQGDVGAENQYYQHPPQQPVEAGESKTPHSEMYASVPASSIKRAELPEQQRPTELP